MVIRERSVRFREGSQRFKVIDARVKMSVSALIRLCGTSQCHIFSEVCQSGCNLNYLWTESGNRVLTFCVIKCNASKVYWHRNRNFSRSYMQPKERSRKERMATTYMSPCTALSSTLRPPISLVSKCLWQTVVIQPS